MDAFAVHITMSEEETVRYRSLSLRYRHSLLNGGVSGSLL